MRKVRLEAYRVNIKKIVASLSYIHHSILPSK